MLRRRVRCLTAGSGVICAHDTPHAGEVRAKRRGGGMVVIWPHGPVVRADRVQVDTRRQRAEASTLRGLLNDVGT